MRRVIDFKAEEKVNRRRRHKNASKSQKQEVHAATREIRADTDPITVAAKQVLSARRMAEAEYEGIEFVAAEGEGHQAAAVKVLQALWPFKSDSMLNRLRARGIRATMAD